VGRWDGGDDANGRVLLPQNLDRAEGRVALVLDDHEAVPVAQRERLGDVGRYPWAHSDPLRQGGQERQGKAF
jgi:hypothetical protein